MKKVLKSITGLSLAMALFLSSITATNTTSYQSMDLDNVTITDAQGTDAAAVARGGYLVCVTSFCLIVKD